MKFLYKFVLGKTLIQNENHKYRLKGFKSESSKNIPLKFQPGVGSGGSVLGKSIINLNEFLE